LTTFENLSGDIAYLASIRGRLGWAINNWLLFGSVGWGFTEFKFVEEAPGATPALNGTGLPTVLTHRWMAFWVEAALISVQKSRKEEQRI
jgi:outer membrane immunogenic protein